MFSLADMDPKSASFDLAEVSIACVDQIRDVFLNEKSEREELESKLSLLESQFNESLAINDLHEDFITLLCEDMDPMGMSCEGMLRTFFDHMTKFWIKSCEEGVFVFLLNSTSPSSSFTPLHLERGSDDNISIHNNQITPFMLVYHHSTSKMMKILMDGENEETMREVGSFFSQLTPSSPSILPMKSLPSFIICNLF